MWNKHDSKYGVHMSHSSWSIAAAIFILNDGAWHYKDLTEHVLNTKLSSLGEKGGKTPWSTLRVDMIEKNPHLFCNSWKRGHYELKDHDTALKDCKVKSALFHMIDFYLKEQENILSKSIKFKLLHNKINDDDSKRINELDLIVKRIYSLSGLEVNPT